MMAHDELQMVFTFDSRNCRSQKLCPQCLDVIPRQIRKTQVIVNAAPLRVCNPETDGPAGFNWAPPGA
jgi:hypothetical protein